MKPQIPGTIKITDKPHMEARIDQLPPLSSAPDYVSKPRTSLSDGGAAEARTKSLEAVKARNKGLGVRRTLAVVALTAAAAAGAKYAPEVLTQPTHETPSSVNYVPTQEQINAMDPEAGVNQVTPPTEVPVPEQPILNDGQNGPQE